jgi:hypothetical protein
MSKPSALTRKPRPAAADPVAQRDVFFSTLALDELVRTVNPAAPAASV